ncbi:hypothetical protein GGR56DRAFT_697615 [Xylariaceae sp. FL0804]|nr:hypothetical protein GGR56DRAFT_697615 [Xylariaceae sp. FL0804]
MSMSMLASYDPVAPPATTGLYFEPLYDHTPLTKPGQPSFKKHKVLPHPRQGQPAFITANASPPASRRHTRDPDGSSRRRAKPSTPPRRKEETTDVRELGTELPPTPPGAHSRTSSSGRSVEPSSLTYVESPVQSIATSSVHSVPASGSPTQQRSPPTPDVTPPRPKLFRPLLADRYPSRTTAGESRAESFTTARENPLSDDEDDKKTTPRLKPASSKTSQSTVRRLADSRPRTAQDAGLGLGLGLGLSLACEPDDNLTPRTRHAFTTFDGEWASASEVEQEWDDNLDRNVIVRKRRGHPKVDEQKEVVIEDATIAPTNATKALRSMPLHERMYTQPLPPPRESTNGNRPLRWASTAPTTSESSMSTDVRRSSAMSSKSTVSTVVEAVLVDAPAPQRPKTLRHVRKQTALRHSISDISPPSSIAVSARQPDKPQRPKALAKHDSDRSESFASSRTMNSIASRKARREVWKSGGIPVIVIPERRASVKHTNPPSLRSTSSHRSKRSNSLSSAPLSNQAKVKAVPPVFDKTSRRGRSMSESDGSLRGDQRTIDYPPIVPMRTSSLSAPTSRNNSRAGSLAGSRAGSQPGSRAGSLTAESLKAHNALLEQEVRAKLPELTVERAPPVQRAEDRGNRTEQSQNQLQPALSVESHRDETLNPKPLVDHNGDPFFGKRLTAHTTPFSQKSFETNGTHSAADIAEAMAVNIYPHQNRSVRMVHHMSKPADPPNASLEDESAQVGRPTEAALISDKPKITGSIPVGVPSTPPQPTFSMDDVDSPLRNPRAPPAPPAIKFIPATPSGLTPSGEDENMPGDYFEESRRKPSLVRRALSLRKSVDNATPRAPGLFARTLSLSRNLRRDTAENPALDKDGHAAQHPAPDDLPHDESKLHPFWRPANDFALGDDEDFVYDVREENDRSHHYPPVDNRPAPPRRSLSERMKRTFSILPIEDDAHYTTADQRSPERRTIKRTPSGSLRVMRHRDSRSSSSSFRWSSLYSHSRDDDNDNSEEEEQRPSTAPAPAPPAEQQRSSSSTTTTTTTTTMSRRTWGPEKRVDPQGRRLFPGSWQDRLLERCPRPPQSLNLNLQRRLGEHRRQKRTAALRRTGISGPREVRDGVGDVVKRNSYKGPSYQAGRLVQPQQQQQLFGRDVQI